MGGDVPAAAPEGVAPRSMQEGSRQLGYAMPPPTRQVQGFEVERGQREKSGQVRARPPPVHVGLSGAYLAVHDHAPRRGPVVEANLGSQIRGSVTVDVAPAVGFDKGQAAGSDSRGHGQSRPPGSGFEHRRPGRAPPFGGSRGRTNSSVHRTDPGPCGRVPGTAVPRTVAVPLPLAAPWRWKAAPLSHRRSACQ